MILNWAGKDRFWPDFYILAQEIYRNRVGIPFLGL